MNANGYSDKLLRLSLLDGQARCFFIESTNLVERARQIHTLSRTATAALGRALTAAAMMGAMLKGEKESVLCQFKGGGPLGTVLAAGKADGTVKGYVDHPEVDPPRQNGKLNVGGAVGKDGSLTVVKDLGLREPYVGQVRLVSGEIAEDIAMYFTASEQTPSLVSLGVRVKDTVIAAGGLIIQMMPGASEAAIASVEGSAGLFMDISATMENNHIDGALTQLLSHLQPEVLSECMPAYKCDCSRERMERALISLGEEELTGMIRDQHGAELNCHFCNRCQRFTEAELTELLNIAKDRRKA